MGIVLTRLQALGTNLPNAEIDFHRKRFLIRGPSETGKSYIRDCLWYLLGGDKQPKRFPLAEGYQELRLRFEHDGEEYEIRRALTGGDAEVYSRQRNSDDEQNFDIQDDDVGELLVRLSGASGKQILRSQSQKGAVTGDDMRHWSLLSQTAILSEEPTAGDGFAITKRVASFNLFLSGTDDEAIKTRMTTAEVERIKGQLSSAEGAYKRIQAGLPKDTARADVKDALERVDQVLSAMADQHEGRAEKLRHLRRQIADAIETVSRLVNERNHSGVMIGRFELIGKKYTNDLERLGATDEGVAFFESLPITPCPLCHTPIENQLNPSDLNPDAPSRYREAITAEIIKIKALNDGLIPSLTRERERFATVTSSIQQETSKLNELQNREALVLRNTRIEFSADPKTLALQRSELSAFLAIFDEMDRLEAEIERLKKSKVRPRIQINRDGGTNGRKVADTAKAILHSWGLSDVQNISLDAEACDLVLNDRPRLSYGAGRRALYLAALTIALMEHALDKGHPHLGTVVIDSPLKAYADPKFLASENVSLSTVTDNFYKWLANWSGNGQIIVLENEEIQPTAASMLNALEFTGTPSIGREGFYPWRNVAEYKDADGESDDAYKHE